MTDTLDDLIDIVDDPPPDLTCVHAERGLCEACLLDYREEPCAYLEWGDHPAGLERWEAFCEDLAREREEHGPVADDPTIPF